MVRILTQGYRAYTDGSKIKHGTCAGNCIMKEGKVLRTRALGLSKNTTVFQAELQAIRLACSLIDTTIPKGEVINIMVDSQAAILALDNIDTNSEIVKHTKNALNKIGEDYTVIINWIKAHVNNLGNEIADRAAKTGSMLQPTCQIKNSKAQVKAIIDNHIYNVWDREWQTLPNCRQAFEFYKNIDRAKSKKIYKLNRYDLGILIQYTTGHAHLQRHNKIANTEQPKAYSPHMKYKMDNPAEDNNMKDDPDIR